MDLRLWGVIAAGVASAQAIVMLLALLCPLEADRQHDNSCGSDEFGWC